MTDHPPLLCRIAAAAITLTLLSACKPPTEGEQAKEELMQDPSGLTLPIPKIKNTQLKARTIAFLLRDGRDPYQSVQAHELGQMLRSASGYDQVFQDAKGSAAAQMEQLRALSEKKPHAVLIMPVDAKEVAGEIASLRQAGVFVVGLDGSFAADVCDTVVFTDQKKIGAAAGDMIVKALRRKAQEQGQTAVQGRVVQIRIDDTLPASSARNEGFLTALKAESGLVMVHDAAGKGDPAIAATLLTEALRLQKQIDAIYVHSDLMARGVHEAALKAGIRETLLIVGTDGTGGPGGGLEMLHQTLVDATVHQPLLVNLAWQIISLHDSDSAFRPKARYEIEPVAITPKNLEETRSKGIAIPAP